MSIISLMPYILAVQACILGVVGTWLVWHFKLRTVYKIDYYKPLETVANAGLFNKFKKKYHKVGEKEFRPDDREVYHKKHGAVIIKFEEMLYSDGRKHVWAYDVVNKRGLTFGGEYNAGDPDYTEDLLFSGVLHRFAKLINALSTETWLLIIVLVAVAIMAFGLGLFASPHILAQPVPVPVNVTTPPTV